MDRAKGSASPSRGKFNLARRNRRGDNGLWKQRKDAMGRKPDLGEIDKAASNYCAAHGIDGQDARRFRRRFGRFLEEMKGDGAGGTLNDRGDFTWDELQALLEEFHNDWR